MKKKNVIGLSIVGVTLFCAGILLLIWNGRAKLGEKDLVVVQPEELPLPPMLYGLNKDSFHIEQSRVARGQNLASILHSRGVGFDVTQQLVLNSKGVFDPRHIRAGNQYTFFFCKDSISKPAWFVYRISEIDYLVMQLGGSLEVSRGQMPVNTVQKIGGGEINSSLWNSIVDNNMNPMLAMELSEIFAWTVDFFGIEAGDSFRVIYEESYVDSTAIGISAVHAAIFTHKGRDFYAFRFMEDSTWGFFDEQGNSVKRAFLKAPLKFSRISSRFSNSRFHPILRIHRPHHGVDFAAPEGTPVYAIGDGTIIGKGWDSNGGGNFVRIRHNSVYTSLYMHLRGFARGIRSGQWVQQGELIGYVGSTGLATGPHLCFRVFRNGSPVDPLGIESPPVDPVYEGNMERFATFISPLKRALESDGNPDLALGLKNYGLSKQ